MIISKYHIGLFWDLSYHLCLCDDKLELISENCVCSGMLPNWLTESSVIISETFYKIVWPREYKIWSGSYKDLLSIDILLMWRYYCSMICKINSRATLLWLH